MKTIMAGVLAMTLSTTGKLKADEVGSNEAVELGQPSLSLNVRDISESNGFYQKLGFLKIAGDIDQKWLILRHEGNQKVIGLFQDQFPGTFTQTFNPLDVRKVQKQLKEKGIIFTTEAQPGGGPAHATLKDPDGNTILLDQH